MNRQRHGLLLLRLGREEGLEDLRRAVEMSAGLLDLDPTNALIRTYRRLRRAP